jgi:acylphosphatase
MAAYRYLARGHVQGVGYRYFVMQQAQALGVTGYARNLPDGTVEVVAEGRDEALADFEARLRDGPGFARVDAVERSAIAVRGDKGFQVR